MMAPSSLPAVSQPDDQSALRATRFGIVQVTTYNVSQTQSRNANYTTRYLKLDADLLKTFAISERWKAELRGEFFNVTNNQNFDTLLSKHQLAGEWKHNPTSITPLCRVVDHAPSA